MIVFLLIFLGLFLFQIYFLYLYTYKKTKEQKNTASNRNSVPVSVLICAKNEAENLRKFLQLILEQSYANADWELVVVNDGSTDDSLEVLHTLSEQYARLTVH